MWDRRRTRRCRPTAAHFVFPSDSASRGPRRLSSFVRRLWYRLCRCFEIRGTTMTSDVSKITQAILDIERSINERWNNGDCSGYIETYSEDVTYFDPATDKLMVGRKAVEDHIRRLYKN